MCSIPVKMNAFISPGTLPFHCRCLASTRVAAPSDPRRKLGDTFTRLRDEIQRLRFDHQVVGIRCILLELFKGFTLAEDAWNFHESAYEPFLVFPVLQRELTHRLTYRDTRVAFSSVYTHYILASRRCSSCAFHDARPDPGARITFPAFRPSHVSLQRTLLPPVQSSPGSLG
jgi:hypothetical protein